VEWLQLEQRRGVRSGDCYLEEVRRLLELGSSITTFEGIFA
jgi:hypothetical protein